MLATSVTLSHAEGGIAELKALTGDAPYLGFGNQEQAPEYFGSALVRQYYRDPISYSAPYGGGSQYGGYGGMHYGYRSPYRAYGNFAGTGYQMPGIAVSPVGSGVGSPVGGGAFYTGGGNPWVRK
ncbi:hypothetical protein AAVH_02792 [Aphelenchoides avenae]|nr:hypothetical protein AAVH_02792 [Aphelenchus avenae]